MLNEGWYGSRQYLYENIDGHRAKCNEQKRHSEEQLVEEQLQPIKKNTYFNDKFDGF